MGVKVELRMPIGLETRLQLLAVVAVSATLAFLLARLAGLSVSGSILAGEAVAVGVMVIGYGVRTRIVRLREWTVTATPEHAFSVPWNLESHLFVARGATLLDSAGTPGLKGFRWRMKLPNGRVARGEIMAAEPPLTRVRTLLTSTVSHAGFEAVPGGTLVRQRFVMTMPLLGRLYYSLHRFSIDTQIQEQTEGLKAAIEGPAAPRPS